MFITLFAGRIVSDRFYGDKIAMIKTNEKQHHSPEQEQEQQHEIN